MLELGRVADDREREAVPWELLVGQHGLTRRQHLARTLARVRKNERDPEKLGQEPPFRPASLSVHSGRFTPLALSLSAVR